jgi:hypothetical protein
MYYPYFRGKQFELVLLREKAELIASNDINPIIEFVKNNASSAQRVLENLVAREANFTVIVNPLCGELVGEQAKISEFVENFVPADYESMSLGYIVDANTNIQHLGHDLSGGNRENYTIIHYGYPDGQRLAEVTNGNTRVRTHVFIDNYSSRLYRRHFRRDGINLVLIRDGFRRMRNEDYPPNEHFSDLHITFEEEGMNGFGDFLIVGDEYREAGGPAYAVAIHMTYLNQENDMFIMHFVSDSAGSPVNPAGKFHEAVEKLVAELDRQGTQLFCSGACNEYKEFYNCEHFPGLGYVKKLSMQHHIELMADFLS